MRLSIGFFAAMLLAACGSRGASPAHTPEPFANLGTDPDISPLIEADTRRAIAAGAGPHLVVAVGAGAPGDRVSGVVAVPSDVCVLVLARGTPTIDDVDLFVYAEDGTVLGVDETPERIADVLVCPPHPRHLYVVGRIASGHGLLALSAQQVPPSRAEAVAQAMGTAERIGDFATSAEAWPGLEDKVVAHQRELGGTWKNVRRTAVPLDPRTPTRISARVHAGECLDALILPSDEVSHLDVTALSDDGRIVGRALAFGRDRTLMVCSPAQSTVTLELRPHAGRGVAAVVLSRSADIEATEVHADVLRYDLLPIAALADQKTAHRNRLERRGYGASVAVAEAEANVGTRSSLSLKLPAGCSRLDLVAGTPARGIEAWLWSAQGALLSRSEGGAGATLFTCAGAQQARLDFSAISRKGPVAIELRTEPSSPAPLLLRPLAAGRLLARFDALEPLPGLRNLAATKTVRLSSTKLVTERLSVPAGRCQSVVVALDVGAVGAEVRIVDPKSSEEVLLARGNHAASARVCALDVPAPLELELELRVTAGEADALLATRLIAPRME